MNVVVPQLQQLVRWCLFSARCQLPPADSVMARCTLRLVGMASPVQVNVDPIATGQQGKAMLDFERNLNRVQRSLLLERATDNPSAILAN